MKTSLATLLLLFSFSSFAQAPFGTLFANVVGWGGPNQPTLGYMVFNDSPASQSSFTVIDSVQTNDLAVAEYLYTCNDTMIWWYDYPNYQRQDSVSMGASKLRLYGDQLLVLSYQPPHFRALDRNNNLSTLFSVDTPLVAHTPHDIVVMGDTAWLLMPFEVIPIDLVNQNVLPAQTVLTNFTGLRSANKMTARGANLYILADYWTALPRSDLFRFNTQTNQSDSLVHHEFTFFHQELIATDDAVFFSAFPTRYDLTADSLVNHMQDTSITVAYDPLTETVFTSSRWTVPSRIVAHQNLQPVSGLNPDTIPSEVYVARFVPYLLPLSIGPGLPEAPGAKLFPNPAGNTASLHLPAGGGTYAISVWNIKGQQVIPTTSEVADNQVTLSVAGLPNGYYVVRATNGTEQHHLPLIVNR